MREGFTQNRCFLQVSTPLGEDALLLDALQGQEGISELFGFRLSMRSGSTDLDASAVVGQEATVSLQIEGGPRRCIHGLVTRFVRSGLDRDFTLYEAELVPRLWLLRLSRDRRIYQQKSVPEIVQSVLDDFDIAWEDRLGQSYPPREYVVQYDETALDFIGRLMEGVGIFYHFAFSDGAHTLVLGDGSGGFDDCEGTAELRFFAPGSSSPAIDTVVRLADERTVTLGKAVADDYDFTVPGTSLIGEYAASQGEGSHYEFGSGLASVDQTQGLARLRVEASQVQAQTLRGDSQAYALSAGTRFVLREHFVSNLNAAYVVRRVSHSARVDGYANTFEAFADTVTFRPPPQSPRPRVSGCETAWVVGPSGEEIWTDEHGRVKVQFPWDREGQKDDNSSPWIRVAQSVAGPGFGSLFLPRVGQEVVVSYLQGDPQQPLVTGCVYNGDCPVPVDLPAQQTASVIRTRSSKGGTAGNEIRLEDKTDEEVFYLHAQRDMTVEIENALSTTLLKGAETHTLQEGDRLVELQKGNETHKVAGTRSLEITGDESHVNTAQFSHTVSGDYELRIDGQLRIVVGGAIQIQSGADFTTEAGAAMSHQAGSSLEIKAATDLTAQAGMNLSQQAGLQMEHKAAMITSKADATQTVEAGAVLTLKGALTQVN